MSPMEPFWMTLQRFRDDTFPVQMLIVAAYVGIVFLIARREGRGTDVLVKLLLSGMKECFPLHGKRAGRLSGLQDEISENTAHYERTLSLAMQILVRIRAEHSVPEKYYTDSMDFDGVGRRLAATIDAIARQAALSG